MNKKLNLFFIISLFLLIGTTFVHAAEENDLKTSSGVEFDNIIIFVSSILATVLFIISAIAYKRDGRQKLLYVCLAFFLFAVKGFLLSSDVFFSQKGVWVDPLASILDFAILLSFFAGLLKK